MTKEEVLKAFHRMIQKTGEYFTLQEKFSQEDSNLYIRGYLATVINYCRAISNSLKLNDTITIPPVFRSLIEAHVDLINLCQDQDYFYVLYYHNLHNKISMLERTFDERDNPFFADPGLNDKEKAKKIKEYRREREKMASKIKKFGKNIADVSNRFKLAGIKEVHSSIYKLQSQNVHNDISIVEDRHFVKYGHKHSVLLNKKTYVDFAPQIITTLAILEMSIVKVSEVLKWTNFGVLVKEIQTMEDQFNAHFKKYYR